MRAHLVALAGRSGLHAAGAVGLTIAWIYAVDRSEAAVGLAFLVVAVVALGWARWMRHRESALPNDADK